MLPMWSRLGRRVVDFSIGFFALLGFVLVPLGERTAYEHVKAIFTSGPAVEAGHELLEAGIRVRGRLLGGDPRPTEARPARPTGSSVASEPTPEPPSLAQMGVRDAGVDASLRWPDS